MRQSASQINGFINLLNNSYIIIIAKSRVRLTILAILTMISRNNRDMNRQTNLRNLN